MEATTVNEMPSLEEEDLGKCGCVKRPENGYRVLKTQHGGRILEHPIVLGEVKSMFEATELVEENRGGGVFSVIYPLYECGHDHSQWMTFWK